MEEEGVSGETVTQRLGHEEWWTRLQALKSAPGFDNVLDVEVRRMRIAN